MKGLRSEPGPLKWDPVIAATAYHVDRDVSVGHAESTACHTTAPSMDQTETDEPPAGQIYFYRVTADHGSSDRGFADASEDREPVLVRRPLRSGGMMCNLVPCLTR